MDLKGGDAHQRFHSFALRERLLKANGRADNMVMLHEDFRNGLSSPIRSQLIPFAFGQMTEWIKNIKADTAEYASSVEKLARNKPATLEEGCMTRDATAVFVPEKQVTDVISRCGGLYVWSYPRGVAGESIAEDVIKCQLKPIDLADYTLEVPFTPDELDRLNRTFPDGVCDYTKPGVGQQPPTGSWLRY